MPRKFLIFMAAFCCIVTLLCGIFYFASNQVVRLNPRPEIAENSSIWIHAGEKFMWTIEE